MSSPLSHRDSSDLLNPIIIKELRQGMRGRSFLASFLLVQFAMIFCVSGALLAHRVSDGGQIESFTTIFWFIIAVPLIGILPLTGLGSLRKELQTNSIELVYLTRLTPWGIVAGKWAALCAQSLLFVFAVLPYLVLRYFLGGVDLLNELEALLILLGLCLLLTAAAVGFSAHSPWLIRGAIVLFVMFGFNGILMLAYAPGIWSGGFVGTAGIDLNPYVLAPVFGTLGLFLMLEIGTAKIAPAAVSRSLQFRGLGLLILGAAAALHLGGGKSGLPLLLAAPPLFLICTFSLAEPQRWIATIYEPLARRGWLGRTIGRSLFYPGWPSAVGYTSLVAAIYYVLVIDLADWSLLPLLVVFASLIFSTAVTRLIRPLTCNGFAWFLGIQIVMLFAAIGAAILNEAGVQPPALLLAALPTSAGLLMSWDVIARPDHAETTTVIVIVLALSLLILGLRARLLLPRLREMEKAAAAGAVRS